jgi:hypothetical protein
MRSKGYLRIRVAMSSGLIPMEGDLVEMSDLVPLRCDVKTTTIDNDQTLMQINITGTADLQRNIRLLCKEYIDIF